MTRCLLRAALVASALAAPALAFEPAIGARVGSTPSEIAAAIAADGYAVRKVERRGERIEVHVEKDGVRSRYFVDAPSGEIAELGGLGAGPAAGMRLGQDEGAVRAALEADGYDVRKIERERGGFEVYAMKDGRRFELKVDGRTGEIVKVEEER